MRRRSIALVLALMCTLLLGIPVCAAENECGNEWVYDEAQVVSSATEEYIKNLNETVFIDYRNKPQLAMVVIQDLPYDIEDYKLDLFNDYGVGTAEENCGMLFLFAINDREYALEIGDGFEQGSLLRKDLESDFITEDMKESLREGDYDAVVLQVAQYLEEIMAEEEAGVYAQREAEKLAEEKARAEKTAAALAAVEKTLKTCLIAVCIFFPAAGFCVLAVWLVKNHLRKKKVAALVDSHYKYFSMAQIDRELFQKYLDAEHSDVGNKDLEQKFLEYLYFYYLDVQMEVLENTAPEPQNLPMYKAALRSTNDLRAFMDCRLISLDEITHRVDESERKKAETQKTNAELIEQFLRENEHRIVHKDMRNAIRNSFGIRLYTNKLVSQEELEATFVQALNEANFQWEVDRFLEEHADQACGQYFDRSGFYKEMYSSENYRNYQYSQHYDRSWMYPMLVMHMGNRKRAHQERIRREEETRQAREAARRREQQRMQSNNSSFGSNFGGGFSSGGGFKGGW